MHLVTKSLTYTYSSPMNVDK